MLNTGLFSEALFVARFLRTYFFPKKIERIFFTVTTLESAQVLARYEKYGF